MSGCKPTGVMRGQRPFAVCQPVPASDAEKCVADHSFFFFFFFSVADERPK
jgi:hypothetical protein